jgi:hypothetical protein
LAIAVDTAGGALVTGQTDSPDFPITVDALQTTLGCATAPTCPGTQNAFFAHIDTQTTSGTSTQGSYSTYFGGNGPDRGTSITVDQNLNTYFAGDTASVSPTGIRVFNPLQQEFTGSLDAFAVELQPANELCITCIPVVSSPADGLVGAGNPISETFTVSNNGPDLATNITVTGTFSTNTAATFTTSSAGSGSPCSVSNGTSAVCLIPTLQAGSIATVEFSLTPTVAGTGQVTATATNSTNTIQGVSKSVSFQATSYTTNILPSSQTVVAGNTAVYSVLVSPVITYGNNVTLSCSGTIPAGASCGFTPATLNFNGPGGQSSTLNLTTTARPLTTISSTKWTRPFYALWLLAPGMAVIGVGGGKKRRRQWLGLFVVLTLLAVIVPLPGCSHGHQQPTVTGTPAGSYSLQITASSGSFTQSSGFSLTVQ